MSRPFILFGLFMHAHQALGLRIRQWLQDYAIDNREHHRGRSDPESQCRESDCREPRLLAQRA